MKSPDDIARQVLEAHAIRADWLRTGDQVRGLLAEAAGAARQGYVLASGVDHLADLSGSASSQTFIDTGKYLPVEPQFEEDGKPDPFRNKWDAIKRDDYGPRGPYVPNGYAITITGIDPLSGERREVTLFPTSQATRAILARLSEEARA